MPLERMTSWLRVMRLHVLTAVAKLMTVFWNVKLRVEWVPVTKLPPYHVREDNNLVVSYVRWPFK
jgi:hypothetical protein